ncbi:hypothetical protein P9112_002265 [Eukaryota sp. TZLM1-RC]
MPTTLAFRIHYNTAYGEVVCVRGSIPDLGDNDRSNALTLSHIGDGNWIGSVDLSDTSISSFSYRYFISRAIVDLEEHGPDRLITFDPTVRLVRCSDTWRSLPTVEDFIAERAVFRRVLCIREKPESSADTAPSPVTGKVTLRFSITVPRLDPGHHVVLVGEGMHLGEWNPDLGIKLNDASFPLLSCDVLCPSNHLPFHYKYVIVDSSKHAVHWEEGPNRTFDKSLIPPSTSLDVIPTLCHQEDGIFRYPGHANGKFKGFGVICPIFSLRSKSSCGIGEFNDLKLAANWLKSMDAKLIQVLPINDTRSAGDWRDSYPYSAISAFALHPVYIHLEDLPGLTREMKDDIEHFKQEINNQNINDFDPEIQFDYEKVVNFKEEMIRKSFENCLDQLNSNSDFMSWASSQSWLPWYAAFLYLRSLNGDNNWRNWPEEHKYLSLEQVKAIVSTENDYYKEILFTYFTQYHLHLQLLSASQYAAHHGIAVKGDIPIGVDPNSVDVWQNPDEYKLDKTVGAPPDAFSSVGQNWLFPPYNFPTMLSKENPLDWWQTRMRHMSIYFHAFRIDHIIGLFRIWEISADANTAIMGRFEPSIKFSEHDIVNRFGLWDLHRLSLPFVNDHILWELFGDSMDEVRDLFFETFHDRLQFKKELLESEKALYKHVMAQKDAKVNEGSASTASITKRFEDFHAKLLTLWNDRVFIAEQEGSETFYYPLFDCKKTFSFRWLPLSDQAKVAEIHYQYCYGPAQNNLWRDSAYRKLPSISQCHDMLVCGEDLGVVPQVCEEVMDELKILGLRIQRMPNDPKVKYGHPSDYSWLTVSCPSTHDMPSIRGWIEEDHDRAHEFCQEILGIHYVPPIADLVRRILDQHVYGPSMWTIFLVQDLVSVSERLRWKGPAELEQINIPANRWHYWRYRLHLNLEDLVYDREFNNEIKKLLKNSGRSEIY